MVKTYREGDIPVPGYQLLDFLGRGGFGEVWKGTAPGGFEVAIKIINLSAKPGLKEFRALQLVRRIRHPNLVPVTAFWVKDQDGRVLDDDSMALTGKTDTKGTKRIQETTVVAQHAVTNASASRPSELVIAMGLGDINLFDRLKQCQKEGLEGIPVAELLDYMDDAAAAIDYMNSSTHDLGEGPVAIQHCDIKPHNILIVSGRAQVCDFGLARVLGDVKTTSTSAGTIAYAPPECFNDGKPSAYTDQYSLGLSYFELRTGDLPFSSENWMEVLNAVQQGQLELDRLPEPERAVIAKGTAKTPSDRYETTVDMVRALRIAVEGETRATVPMPAPPVAAKIPLPAVVALAVASVALVGVLIFFLTRDSGSAQVVHVPAPTAVESFKLAEQKLADGDLQAAIADYSRALEADPKWIEPRLARAAAYLQLKDYDRAIYDYQEAEQQDVSSQITDQQRVTFLMAYYERAKQLLADDKPQLAVADFTHALALRKEHFESLLGRAEAELALGHDQNALADVTRAQSVDREGVLTPERLEPFAAAWLREGERLCGEEQFNEAQQAFTQAIALRMEDPALRFARGRCYLAQHKYDPAIEDFETAIALDPDNELGFVERPEYSQAYLGRGQQRFKGGNFEDSISDLTLALEYSPPDPAEIYLLRGTSHLELAQFEAAIEDFDASIGLNKQDPRAFSRRGTARFQLGTDDDGALADYSEAIRLSPDGTDYKNRAQVYIVKQEFAKAIADCTEAIRLDSKDFEAFARRGEAYLADEQYRLALLDCSSAINLKKDYPLPYRTRAITYLAQGNGQEDQAAKDLSQAIALDHPWLLDCFRDRELVFEALGDEEHAKYDQQVIKLFEAVEESDRNPDKVAALAWHLATSPVDTVRCGPRAVRLASEAAEASEFNNAAHLDVLAAALAETGDFEEAARREQQAIAAAGSEAVRKDYQQRLKLYQAEKPFRQQ